MLFDKQLINKTNNSIDNIHCIHLLSTPQHHLMNLINIRGRKKNIDYQAQILLVDFQSVLSSNAQWNYIISGQQCTQARDIDIVMGGTHITQGSVGL